MSILLNSLVAVRVVPTVTVMSLVLFLAGCEEPVVETGPIVRPVKMFDVGAGGTGGVLEYPGTIKATQQSDMAFEVPGKIKDFLVLEGDLVEQGQELARLDDRDYQADLDVAKANLKKSEADYARSMSIFKQDPGAITQTKIDADKQAVEVSQAQLKQSEKAVDDTVLRAPFAGVMARKLVRDFQNVQAKEAVLILQDNSRLEVEISIPERDITRSTEGSDKSIADLVAEVEPEIIINSIPDRSFSAKVKEYATTADPVTRTFPIRFIFDNPSGVKILPGMTSKVQVNVDLGDTLWVPAHAVVADAAGKPFVWVIDPSANTVGKKPVELGGLVATDVEITSGLEGGEVIALSGIHQLRDGMQVRRYER